MGSSESINNKRKMIILYWNFRKKGFDYGWWIYQAAIEKKIAVMITPPELLQNRKSILFHQIHCKGNFPLKKFWYFIYTYKLKLSTKEKYTILINDQHPCLCNLKFLDYLKSKYNVKLVLTVRNLIKNKNNPKIANIPIKKLKQIFDLIVTDEPNDTDIFGFEYFPDPFDNMYKRENIEIKNDICFCGGDKKRLRLLKEIYNEGKKQGIKCDFKIVEGQKSNIQGIQFVPWQPYPDVVKQDLQANCILEILQPGQNGFTLRMQEAISCNRKLLTNNLEAKKNKYYDERYIQIFDKIDDIDFSFVKEKIPVNYHYKGEFSSCTFLHNIERKLEK